MIIRINETIQCTSEENQLGTSVQVRLKLKNNQALVVLHLEKVYERYE